MTRPTANTEAGGAKILILSDSTATTPVAKNPAAIQSSASGDANSPVGWLGIATHRDTDTLGGAGGFTPALAPVALVAGADGASATEASRIVRPWRVHEGGSGLVLPGSSYTAAGVYVPPLQAVGGSLLAAAATANQVLTSTLASNFGYLTDILVELYVTSANASTLEIRDASGGNVLFKLQFAASALGTTITEYPRAFHFSVPLRTAATGAAFYATTTGATTQWAISCNGFFSTAV